jgi:hypothetical protein
VVASRADSTVNMGAQVPARDTVSLARVRLTRLAIATVGPGKVLRPTAFGNLVTPRLRAQVITDYEVCEGRVADHTQWIASPVRHEHLIERVP